MQKSRFADDETEKIKKKEQTTEGNYDCHGKNERLCWSEVCCKGSISHVVGSK